MSAKYYFIDKHGHGQMMQFIRVSNPQQIRKRGSENPANSEDAKKPKPASPSEVHVRGYLDNKLKQIHGMTRCELEKLTIGILSDLIDYHIKTDELLGKFNTTKQELALTQMKYNHLESQISQLSSTITTIRQKFHELEAETKKITCMENSVLQTIQRIPTHFTVQHGRDVILIDLTGEDNTTAPNVVISSEQAPVGEENSVTEEDTSDATTPEIAEQPASSQKSHTPEAMPQPVLPIIYFIEPSSKSMAPAPEIRTHLMLQQEDGDIQLRVGPFSSPISITFKDGAVKPDAS